VNRSRASTARQQFGSDPDNIKTDVQREHIMRTGKIARLPHPIREQLNRRLESCEDYEPILNWLNALPEARQVIDDHFAGRPISKQNLSDWRSGGFSEWQDRQDAVDFLTNLDDQSDPNPQTSSSPSTGRMALWLSLQYALAARALVRSTVDQPARWARLREICADIARLRRSDLFAERIELDRAWLAFEESNTAQKKEKEFWAWTERADIREKLFPDREAGLSPETLEKIEKELNLM